MTAILPAGAFVVLAGGAVGRRGFADEGPAVAAEELHDPGRHERAVERVQPLANFAAALEADHEAKRTRAGLSNGKRRCHVLQIEGAKSPATRQRRAEKSFASLREGRPRWHLRHHGSREHRARRRDFVSSAAGTYAGLALS